MKILRGETKFHVDGRTDRRTNMTKLIVAFANAPENVKCEFVNTRLLDPVTRTHLNSTNADFMIVERHQPVLFVAYNS
jgi:hypothetical protein